MSARSPRTDTARQARGARAPSDTVLLVTLVLVVSTTAMVSSLGAPLIPRIADRYEVSLQSAQWSQAATLVVAAVLTPIIGRFGGGMYRRPTILTGLLLVCLGLLTNLLAASFAWVLVGRAVQGVGMALTPLAIATARDSVTEPRRASAVAMVSGAQIAGVGLGYPITGLVADLGGVSASYGLGLGLAACSLVVAWVYVPAALSSDRDSVDVLGAALLGLGTAAFLLVISQGVHWGWASPASLSLLGAAVVLLALWVVRSLRVSNPLVDLRLAVRPGVLGPNVASVVAGMGMCLILTLVIIQVQASSWGLGHSAGVAGLVQTPYSVMSVVGTVVVLRLGRWLPFDLLLPVGCVIYIVAAGYLAVWHDNLVVVMIGMAVAGLGSGCTFAILPLLIVRRVPSHEMGSAVAFNQVLRILGFSFGTTLGVTILGLFDTGGEPTQRGFVTALLVAAGAMAVAAALAVALRDKDRAESVPHTEAVNPITAAQPAQP